MKYLIVLSAVAAAACGKSEAAQTKPDAPTLPVTEVFPLAEGILDSQLKVPGELIAFERVDLYAKTSSFVQKLYVDVGSEVKQGNCSRCSRHPKFSRSSLRRSPSWPRNRPHTAHRKRRMTD